MIGWMEGGRHNGSLPGANHPRRIESDHQLVIQVLIEFLYYTQAVLLWLTM